LSIFGGYYFYPYKEITREEMAVITAKAVINAESTGERQSFKDIPQYYRYKESIDRVTELGIITGLPDVSFNPKGKATRAQAAAVIGRVLKTREAAKEEDDSILTAFSSNYEKSVINSLSEGDLSFDGPMALSTGREDSINAERSELLNIQYPKGFVSEKHIENQSVEIVSKSSYLAETNLNYELVFDTGSNAYDRYTVRRKLYLKDTEDGWRVYNSRQELADDLTSGDKVNLTWHQIWSSTPDMSGVRKVDGLNVVSPTWFTLANENGELEYKGSTSYISWAHKMDIRYGLW
jgi:hypothetical protein